MAFHKSGVTSFVLLSPGPRPLLASLLRSAFSDPWVGSYQIGFGPPLIKSSAALTERLKGVLPALQKLEIYLDVCLAEEERRRLAKLQRALLVRRHGPLEAEAVDEASADVFDLSLRLHTPLKAPEPVRASMIAAGVELDWVDEGLAPDSLSGRFYVHLEDPDGERLLSIPEVAKTSAGLAVELRVPIVVRRLFLAWLERRKRETGASFVDLGAPVSHARVVGSSSGPTGR